jgi:hypothetical protein
MLHWHWMWLKSEVPEFFLPLPRRAARGASHEPWPWSMEAWSMEHGASFSLSEIEIYTRY